MKLLTFAKLVLLIAISAYVVMGNFPTVAQMESVIEAHDGVRR